MGCRNSGRLDNSKWLFARNMPKWLALISNYGRAVLAGVGAEARPPPSRKSLAIFSCLRNDAFPCAITISSAGKVKPT